MVVADAGTLCERAADDYVGETVTLQVRDADLLILDKIDTVSEEDRHEASDRLQRKADGTTVVSVANATVPPEILMNLRTDSDPVGLTQLACSRISAIRHEATIMLESLVLTFALPTSVIALAEALTSAGSGVLSANGMLTEPVTGKPVVSTTAWHLDIERRTQTAVRRWNAATRCVVVAFG